MTKLSTANARLQLRGHDSTPAEIDLEGRTRKTRLTRTIVALVGFWILTPLVALIPPHVPWAVGAFLAGIYFAFKEWRGEYIVRSFSGTCPRCQSELSIEAGTKIRLPYSIVCYKCHHEPTLQLAE